MSWICCRLGFFSTKIYAQEILTGTLEEQCAFQGSQRKDDEGNYTGAVYALKIAV
jgi:hypothetical protein